jgi:hypothetical protein
MIILYTSMSTNVLMYHDVVSGGKLYSATVSDSQARDPLILMSDHEIVGLRTKQHPFCFFKLRKILYGPYAPLKQQCLSSSKCFFSVPFSQTLY